MFATVPNQKTVRYYPQVVRVTLHSRGTQPLYAVRVGADSRDVADRLCERLRAAGGACVVVRNASLSAR